MATEKIVDAAEATRAHFDAEAADYDAQRPYRLHYAELQQVMLRAIPYPPETSFIVLELGIGTGLLTEQLLRRFPHATVEAYDLSEEMLARARQRLAPFGRRIKLASGDFSTTLAKATYDLICSSLALHHLPRANRDRFYRRLATCLAPGGALVVGDRIKAPTESLAARYEAMRQLEMRERGWSEEVIAEQRRQQGETRRRLAGVDHSASTLEEFLGYLCSAGLVNVDCLWKDGADVVVYAEQAAQV
jgi:tRNA (cmo5U34)-methyltransferase